MRPLPLSLLLPLLLAVAGCKSGNGLGDEYLDNGQIRIGVSREFGGALVYLAESAKPGRNYINRHDSGRFVQYSYYGTPHSNDGVYPNWAWNPVAGGDGYGNSSRILNISNDGNAIVVRANPMDWSGNNRRTNAVFETRYTLEGRAVRIDNTLYNDAADHSSPGRGYDQETPALYVTTDLSRLVLYGGNAPFSGGAPEAVEPGTPERGASFNATECWAAYVNESDFGVGVCVPGVTHIGNAFRAGAQGVADDRAPDTNYFAFCGVFNITPHLIRTDTAYVILDGLDQIREFAVRRHIAGEQTGTVREWRAEPADGASALPMAETHTLGESVLFEESPQSGPPSARLLFEPVSINRLYSPAHGEEFVEGVDFEVDAHRRRLVLTERSRIPRTPVICLYPEAGRGMLPHRDGRHDLYCASWRPFAEMQLAVDYTHPPDTWPMAGVSGEKCVRGTLPRTRSLLGRGETLRISVLGDSISVGAEATGWWGDIPPHTPPYPELFAAQLREKYGAAVELSNLSAGGRDAAWGLGMTPEVVASSPDLLVVAFGMNDQARGLSPEDYVAGVSGIIASVRASGLPVEFLLVASMVSSPEWEGTSPRRFAAYAEGLREMAGEGIAVADLTGVWTGMLSRKPFHALAGNGVNHPNDFGHRIQAQVLLEAVQPAG